VGVARGTIKLKPERELEVRCREELYRRAMDR